LTGEAVGTTFVSVRDDRGFWIRDGLLELFLRFAALHVEDQVDPTALPNVVRNQWLLASRGFFTGCVPHDIDRFVATPGGREVILQAIQKLISALELIRAPLDHSVLNIMGMEGRWTEPIEKEQLLEICSSMLQLINGEIGSHPSDTSFMPGMPEEVRRLRRPRTDKK